MADEMFKSAADAVGEGQVENKLDANGMEHSEENGKFTGDGDASGAAAETPTKDDAEHSPEEKKRIAEFEASTNQDAVDKAREIVDIFESGKPRETVSKMHANFGTVSDQSAQLMGDLLGYDVSGYEKYFDGSDMLHTWERHGRNGKADHSMADVANFGRAGYVVDHAETIELLKKASGDPELGNFLDKYGKKSPMLMARMRIDGTAAATIVAPDSKKKRIHIVSMRIEQKKPEDVKHQ